MKGWCRDSKNARSMGLTMTPAHEHGPVISKVCSSTVPIQTPSIQASSRRSSKSESSVVIRSVANPSLISTVVAQSPFDHAHVSDFPPSTSQSQYRNVRSPSFGQSFIRREKTVRIGQVHIEIRRLFQRRLTIGRHVEALMIDARALFHMSDDGMGPDQSPICPVFRQYDHTRTVFAMGVSAPCTVTEPP